MALAIDASSPAIATNGTTSTTAVTTASFTPPAGSQLWVGSTANGNGTVGSLTISSTPALTFGSARIFTNTQEGACAWHVADVSVSQSYTVTATRSDAAGSRGVACYVRVITGHEGTPGGQTATANNNSGLPSQTITTTRSGSLILASSSDWSAGGLGTAGTSQTILAEHHLAGDYTGHFWRYDGLPAVSTYTINLTAPSAQDYNLSIVEIRPPAAAAGSPRPFRRYGIPAAILTR